MIIGIGTDLCDIRRISSILDRFGERFENKVFTAAERERAQSSGHKANSLAKRFAAKEAAAKALAGPNTGALSWQDVEVRNDVSGRPILVLHNGAKKRLETRLPQGYEGQIHLSLSDEPPYAQAFVIVEALACG